VLAEAYIEYKILTVKIKTAFSLYRGQILTVKISVRR